MKALLQRLVGARHHKSTHSGRTAVKSQQPVSGAVQDPWAMSADDALRAKTVSGYK